jgi:hypothetical protein
MKNVLKVLLMIIPYFSAVIAGVVIYFIALAQTDDIKSLLINISATFIGIPLIFLGYDTIKGITRKSLNKEILDYIKMQIDHEIFGIINQLMKCVYTYEKFDRTPLGINRFMEIGKNRLRNEFMVNTYLGFQMLKEWEVESNNIKELLKNELVIQVLDDAKKVTLIKILKHIMHFEYLGNLEYFMEIANSKSIKYSCISGEKINKQNNEYPNRMLLLSKVDNKKGKVIDFGDFKKSDQEKLLKEYKIEKDKIDYICELFYDFISEINTWIKQCNSTLLINPRYIRYRVIEDEEIIQS